MSRVGNQPIPVPSGVDVNVGDGQVSVKGPKGQLTEAVPAEIRISVQDGQVKFERPDERKPTRALHGLAREGKVSLCILDESWPFSYLQVYCEAEVVEDPKLVVDVMMAIGGRMSGTPLSEDARPVVEAMAQEEDRIVIRCRPYQTFAQPPRHLHANDQDEEITHWVSASMAWDAEDAPSGAWTRSRCPLEPLC